MSTLRTLILILGSLSFIVVIGGAVYEHIAVVPVWTSAVPASVAMFQGEYPLAAWRFWIPIHPVTMVLLVAAWLANWRTERHKYILVTIAGYAAVLAVTFTVFVPELTVLTQTPLSSVIDPELTRRAQMWEAMSLVRLAFLFVLAIVLLFGLSKPVETQIKA